MVIPSEIVKGESTLWDDEPTSDALGAVVDSSEWTLKYEIRGPSTLTLTAVANGEGWRTTLTVSQSSGLTVGTYYWQAVLTKGSPTITDRIIKSSGRLLVKPALEAASAGYDGRSQARKDLEAVQAAIRSIATGGTKAYTIGTRSFTKIDLPELLALESKLKADVVREERAEMMASGLGDPNNLFVRFGKR